MKHYTCDVCNKSITERRYTTVVIPLQINDETYEYILTVDNSTRFDICPSCFIKALKKASLK